MTRSNIYHIKDNAIRILSTISDVSPIFEGGVLEVRVNLDHPDFPGALLDGGRLVGKAKFYAPRKFCG